MAKKKPASDPVPRTTSAIHIWVSPELRAALDAYLESLEPRPNITSAVRLAIEQLLRSKGYWPPGQRPA